MKKLRDYSKPLMVIENFSANQYVAICAGPSQYLYLDAVKRTKYGTYEQGSDLHFQDSTTIPGWLRLFLGIISAITGNSYTTNGEYTGVRTTSNPTLKGELTDFATQSYPVFGSESQLSNGVEYNGEDLKNLIKKNSNNEYYIQGNMS